jgi:hypothetical protein
MMVQSVVYHVGAELPEAVWLPMGDAMKIRGSLYRVIFKRLLFRVEGSNSLQ